MIELLELEALVGQEFPQGTATIEPYEHWLCADAILSPPLPEGIAHPMYGYYAAIAGMGKSLDEVFADAGSSAAEGPMAGESRLDFFAPLRVGATYTVRGRYTEVARKQGRSGVFDIVTFALDLVDGSGAVVATSTNSFIYPRREG